MPELVSLGRRCGWSLGATNLHFCDSMMKLHCKENLCSKDCFNRRIC